MLRRAKRAAIFASPVVAVGVWAGLVLKERREASPDVRFSIGSAGETAASPQVRAHLRRACEEDSAYTLRIWVHLESSVFFCRRDRAPSANAA